MVGRGLQGLIAVLDLNTRLFLNAFEGVDDATATSRPNGSTNHMAFVACHLVEARHFLARLTGVETPGPFNGILEGAKGIEDVPAYPSLEEIRTAWTEISETLRRRLLDMDDADLAKRSQPSFPVEQGDTLGGALVFLLQHDGFHIGQLALLRRYHGLGAMKYA